jgi:hypothetical protein
MSIPCDRCGEEASDRQSDCPRCGQPLRRLESVPNHHTVEAACESDRAPEVSPLWAGAYSALAALPLWLFDAGAITLVMCVTVPTLGWDRSLFLSLLTASLAVGGTGLYVMYRRLTAHYTLTSSRLMCQTGFFVAMCDEWNVMDIDDVAYSQSRLERLVGVGTIKVMPTNKNRSDLFLNGVGSVKRVAGLIEEASRTERRRRGLFIESA